MELLKILLMGWILVTSMKSHRILDNFIEEETLSTWTKGVREIWCKTVWICHYGFQNKRGAQYQGIWQHLETVRNSQFRASNKIRSSVLQPQGTQFCQQSKWARIPLSPRASRMKCILPTLWFLSGVETLVLDFWPTEL